MVSGKCPNRAESSPMDDTTKSLVLMNFFPDNPNSIAACSNNSAPLLSMLNTCHNASANRWANYIAVDFYKVFLAFILLVGIDFFFNLIFVNLRPLFFNFRGVMEAVLLWLLMWQMGTWFAVVTISHIARFVLMT